MIDLLKKYFWGLNLIVIGSSAYFAARASLHLFEGSYLSDEASVQKGAAPRRTALAPPPPKSSHGKDTRGILERNMFCSDCPPILAKEKEGPEGDDKKGQEVKTNLPIALIATMMSTDPEWSFAVIKDTQGREVDDDRGNRVKVYPFNIYSRGRRLEGHEATIDHVEERRVYLKVGEHVEYADLQGVTGPDKTLVSTKAPGPGGPATGDLQKGVRKISETQYEIDRQLLEKVLSDTNAIARSARVVPSVSPKDGKPNGFKLYAIRPDSVYSTIGLQNGDTVSAINGQEMNSPEKAFELYAKLRTASHLQISIVRRGNPMTVDYSIR
ncbi:MAG TPA: type II secretion system protein GspC [Polyangia bacterium]